MPDHRPRVDPSTMFHMDVDSAAAEFVTNNGFNCIECFLSSNTPNRVYMKIPADILHHEGIMINTNAVNMVQPIVKQALATAADNTTGSLRIDNVIQKHINEATRMAKMKDRNYVIAKIDTNEEIMQDDRFSNKKNFVISLILDFKDVNGNAV